MEGPTARRHEGAEDAQAHDREAHRQFGYAGYGVAATAPRDPRRDPGARGEGNRPRARHVQDRPSGAPGMTAPAMPALHAIPLGDLHESPLNPRKHFDAAKLAELTASVQAKGVQVPLVVRPRNGAGPGYEIGVFIEFLTFENLERDDLTPLEEAEGYRNLTARGYDVQRIADRIGRSVKYVYDRVKLLALTKEAQQLLRAGTITAGHAILLARLSPKDQARCLGTRDEDFMDGGLLKDERTLFDPDEQGEPPATFKPVSVRELEAWIDEHVRFDAAKADTMLFPETVGTVAAAKETAEKIILITHEHYVQPGAREGRSFGPRSW